MERVKRHGVTVEYTVTGSTAPPSAPKGTIGGAAMTSWMRINEGVWMQCGQNDWDALRKALRVDDQDQEDINFLRCLEAAGVDNWEGYDIAKDYLNDGEH